MRLGTPLPPSSKHSVQRHTQPVAATNCVPNSELVDGREFLFVLSNNLGVPVLLIISGAFGLRKA